MSELTAGRLKSLLRYEPDTGDFFWIVDRMADSRVLVHAGERAGHLRRDGYFQIKIDGTVYRAHRLAFLYMLGRWPLDEVDHRNLIKDDNRWCNLREATHTQNMMNFRVAKPSGLPLGVHRTKSGKFEAVISGVYLGTYDTPEEASAAYEQTAREFYGEFYCPPEQSDITEPEPVASIALPPPPPPKPSPVRSFQRRF